MDDDDAPPFTEQRVQWLKHMMVKTGSSDPAPGSLSSTGDAADRDKMKEGRQESSRYVGGSWLRQSMSMGGVCSGWDRQSVRWVGHCVR